MVLFLDLVFILVNKFMHIKYFAFNVVAFIFVRRNKCTFDLAAYVSCEVRLQDIVVEKNHIY